MTDSTSENQALTDQPNPPLWVKLWVKWLRRTAIGLGLVVVVTTAAGGTWLWFFVKNDLGLLVERELTKLIDRPVKIGAIEKFYLTGLKVGLSSLPATESDPDFAEIPTVKVGFNPLTLLLSRTLNLKISLIDPSIYIEQDIQGAWLQLKIKKSQSASKTININIKTLEIDNGQVMLLPNGAKRAQLFELDRPMELNPLVLDRVNIKAKFFNRQTETKYHATARPTSNGYLKINGNTNLSTLDTELYIQGDYLSAVEVMPLIPNLPLRLDSGELNCRLGLNLQETTVLSWNGKANFANIHGYLGNLPQPISDASGQIKFSELQVALDDVKAVYGELPIKVNGAIDTKSDYDLTMSIPSLNLDRYINTLELKLPVPVSGSASTELQVTGPLQSPILSGVVVSTDRVKVDLIDVAAASARFKLEAQGEAQRLEITDILAEPVVGGLVYGRGNIQLTEIPELGFYLLGENLPGDAIAQLYLGEYRGEKLPIKIGVMSGSATVLGQVDKPTTVVKWRAPESMYPGSGEVTITKETTVFRNTLFQVGGGTVKVTGSMVPKQDRWQALFNAQNIELNQLTSPTSKGGSRTAPTPENPAILTGGLRLSGKLSSLVPRDIQGSGELELTTPDAKVTGRGTLDKGQWKASLGVETLPGKALRLHELAPDLPVPMELGSGTLELSGTVDSFEPKFDPKKIDATGSVKLNVADSATVTASGSLDRGQITASATLTTTNDNFLSLNPWTPNLEIPVNLTAGNLELSGPVNSLLSLNRRGSAPMPAQTILNTWSGNSTIQLLIAGAGVTGRGNLQQGQVELSAILNSDNFLSLNPWTPNLEIPVNLTAGNLELSGPVNSLLSLNRRGSAPMPAQTILNTWSGNSHIKVNLAGGTIAGIGHFTGDRWQGSMNAENLNLNPFAPNLSEPVNLATGSLNVSGFLSSFAPQDIQVDGEFTLMPQPPVNYGQVSTLSQFLPLSTAFRWTGKTLEIKQAKSPGLEVDGTLFVQWQEQQPILSNFDLNLKVNQFNLATLSLPIPGREPVTNVNLETPPVPGQKKPSQLPLMPLAIAGLVDFNGRLRGQLNSELFQNYSQAISELLLKSQISIAGDLAAENFGFNDWQFGSLSGKINLETDRGLQVNLAGDEAKISLDIQNPLHQEIPTWSANWLVENHQTILLGKLDRGQLTSSVENFPLQSLKITPAPAYGYDSISGMLSGDLNFDLGRLLGDAKIKIEQPAIGHVQMEKLTGEIYYDRGRMAIANGLVIKGISDYHLDAQFSTDPDASIQGTLIINEGKIQDALLAMRWFNVEDLKRGLVPPNYGNSEIIDNQELGLPNSSLYDQLHRFSEINAKLRQIASDRQQPGFPELLDIRGLVHGEINFEGSLASGINSTFNLKANRVQWRPQPSYLSTTPEEVERLDSRVINIDRVIFQGSFQDGQLLIQPLRLERNETMISFVGTILGENPSGQLQVKNLSGEHIRNFLDVPGYRVDGRLNLTANFAGTLENPQARGEVSFSDFQLNGETYANLKGSFKYDDSRLSITSIEPDYFQIFTSLPVPPSPGNEQFSVKVNVKNKGLTLANILTAQQVTWVDGEGEVNLEVAGKLNANQGKLTEITANGTIAAENATIDAETLPEPLTNVRGRVLFNEDSILVERLQGDFSEGKVVAQGILPIFVARKQTDTIMRSWIAQLVMAHNQVASENTQESQEESKEDSTDNHLELFKLFNSLIVDLDNLNINLPDLYRGGVSGQVEITGTAFSPDIGGQITLSDGLVLLPDRTEPPAPKPRLLEESVLTPQYKDLQLALGENVRIANAPLLEFIGTGTLRVNGWLEDLQPEGIIYLKEGEVNLFTTQFRLAGGYEHFAQFTGDVDPTLEVRLVTSVPEVTRREFSTTSSSEIREAVNTGIGEVRTVRVEALVSGRSSQMFDALELRSNPARDEAEIVALIGGGFVNTLGQGDSPLAIANLAGARVLRNIQNFIGNTIGLSEFRLLPVMAQSGGTTRLALEVEAGIDLSRQLSFSVLWPKIFLDNENTRYNIRYRFSDELLLRGSTDFQGDTRARIDYEFRF